ncbi:uncharacterized protein BDZ83DRAFT_95915 [Colletotrichum acutatum]|uniref:Uncharacterized protein n=1 Tax=Glomerella acutata TaxID=27357 RepID=A0AAD8U8G4_GLOAC|nr:uncharacterized protein BDZ83DRAFT_95915 [Colletotrichum acutatum]KAK1712555.1 hypothetical protein BDZ83DRAFT_95915 [Colletotrichum acutatum]
MAVGRSMSDLGRLLQHRIGYHSAAHGPADAAGFRILDTAGSARELLTANGLGRIAHSQTIHHRH